MQWRFLPIKHTLSALSTSLSSIAFNVTHTQNTFSGGTRQLWLFRAIFLLTNSEKFQHMRIGQVKFLNNHFLLSCANLWLAVERKKVNLVGGGITKQLHSLKLANDNEVTSSEIVTIVVMLPYCSCVWWKSNYQSASKRISVIKYSWSMKSECLIKAMSVSLGLDSST